MHVDGSGVSERIDVDTQISKNLKSLRCFLGFTQGEFARAVGVSLSLISQVERGKKPPSRGFVALVCQTFGVRSESLYEGDLVADAIKPLRVDTEADGHA